MRSTCYGRPRQSREALTTFKNRIIISTNLPAALPATTRPLSATTTVATTMVAYSSATSGRPRTESAAPTGRPTCPPHDDALKCSAQRSSSSGLPSPTVTIVPVYESETTKTTPAYKTDSPKRTPACGNGADSPETPIYD